MGERSKSAGSHGKDDPDADRSERRYLMERYARLCREIHEEDSRHLKLALEQLGVAEVEPTRSSRFDSTIKYVQLTRRWTAEDERK